LSGCGETKAREDGVLAGRSVASVSLSARVVFAAAESVVGRMAACRRGVCDDQLRALSVRARSDAL
jgi:hypothetical protein